MTQASVTDHVIRLRGPWTYLMESGQATESVRLPFTKPLPEPWRGASELIVAKRKFNCPSGLTPTDVVRLTIARRGPLAKVQLNDEPLPISDERATVLEWNITALLVPFNELRISFAGSAIDLATFSSPVAQVELRISAGSNGN